MAQFQVYRNPRASRTRVPYLLDVQSDLVDIATRLVIPMIREADFGARLTRLNPVFDVRTEHLVLATADAAAVPVRELRDAVTDVSHRRAEILSALDFLIHGY